MRRLFALIIICGVSLVLYQNCGNVRLSARVIPSKPPAPLSVSSNIKTCTKPSDLLTRKQRTIFIVDMSLSNLGKWVGTTFSTASATDPMGERFNAIEDYITDCSGPNSEFAVIPFSTVILSTGTTGFVPRASAVTSLVQPLRAIQDNVKGRCPNGAGASTCGSVPMAATGYRRALTSLREFMFTQFNSPDSSGSAYQVFFVTDGAPDPGDCVEAGGATNSPTCFVDLIKVIPHAAVQERNSFNFISVAYGNEVIDMATLNALTQLTGNPQAIRVTNVSDADFCVIQEGSLKTPFGSTVPTVLNLNLILKNGKAEADSDSDGVIDSEDPEPLVRRASNGLIQKVANELGTLAPSCAAPGVRWLGLNDCDRSAISLSATDVDSDGDGLLDVLELVRGLNPKFMSDASTDVDADNDLAWQEVHEGRDPNQWDANLPFELRLVSSSEPLMTGSTQRPSSCAEEQESWQVNLQTLPLSETLAFQDSEVGTDVFDLSHPKGSNLLLIYYIVTPKSGVAVPEVWGVIRTVSKSTTRIDVSPEDFIRLGTVAPGGN